MTQTTIPNSRADLPEEYDGLPLRAIYDGLPEFLKGLLRHHKDPQELTIAMYSVLVTSGALIPNAYVVYGEKRSYPLLFLLLLLPPAGGKAPLGLSRNLLREINRKLTAENESAQKEYQREQHLYKNAVKAGTSAMPPAAPKYRQILLAGNTTSARLMSQLGDNGESIPLVIIETEMDAVSAMLAGEMGVFNSTIFRQIFHHEAVSSARKGNNETLLIERPKMAMILSGTENQLAGLFKGNVDGLFSRFTILELPGNMEWLSARPRHGEKPLEEVYEEYGLKYLKLWPQSQNLSLELKFTNEQWNKQDEMGKELQREAHMMGGGNAVSLARRHMLMATRFCTVLTFLRHIDADKCVVPHLKSPLYPTDEDFSISLHLVKYSFRKALELFNRMPSSPAIQTANAGQLNFYERLPEEFTTAEANDKAISGKNSSRTVDRWLKEFVQTGALNRVARGHYIKAKLPDSF